MASCPKPETGDEPANAAPRGVGVVVVALLQLIVPQVANFLILWRQRLGFLGALWQLEVVRRLQTAAIFLFWGRSGGLGALLQLIEPEDRRLQAATFFLTSGGCTVLYGTALNRSANPEHVLAGFALFTLGAAMAILTLAGAGAGRAAAQMERFIRGFF